MSTTDSGAPPASPNKKRSVQAGLPDARINYTHTKKIPLSQETRQRNRIIDGNSSDAVTTAYKMLRTHVLRLFRQNNWNSLAVTSAHESEGKSLTAINLAISLALEINHTVLLVDLDFRKPGLHNYFEYDLNVSLSNYLRGEHDLSAVLVNPVIDRLVLLPTHEIIENPSEMLSSPRMRALFGELKSRYPSRIIIYDLPPLLSSEDAMAFSPYVDAALLVVEDGRTRNDEVKRSLDMLQSTNVLGTVLNKSDEFSKNSY
jgi:capsular exopolysaccharide synthesis family protein